MNKRVSTFFKLITIYIAFFLLLYYERNSIGGVKISQAWKSLLVICLAIYVIGRKCHRPKFNKFNYGYAFIKFFNVGFFENLGTVIGDFSRFIMLPLLYDFFKIKKITLRDLESFLYYIAQFIILSFIPFITGLIEEYKDVSEMSTMEEIIAEAGETSGLFMTPHGASSLLALSLIIILNRILQNRKFKTKQWWNLLLLAIGTYSIVLTYARGGWLMLVLGILVLTMKFNRKNIISFITISILLFYGISYLMNNNQYFYNRITDKGALGQEQEIGSGRLIFAANGIRFWKESNNTQEYLTGQGLVRLKNYQLRNTGMFIYCHNGFIDALAQNGILGLILFFSAQLCMLLYIYKRRSLQFSRYALAIIIMRIVFQIVQGGEGPYENLIVALSLSLLTNQTKDPQKRLYVKS